MSLAKVSDIFEQLKEENKKLLNELMFANKCLIKLIEFKSFIELIFQKISNNLEVNECQRYELLTQDIDNTFGDRRICELNDEYIRSMCRLEEDIERLISECLVRDSQQPVRSEDTQTMKSSDDNQPVIESETNGEPQEGVPTEVSTERPSEAERQADNDLDDLESMSDEEEDDNEEFDSAEDYEPDNLSELDDGVSDESSDDDFPRRGPKKWKDEKIFECDINGCGEIFDLKYDLMEHKKNVHSITERKFREKKFVCPHRNCSFKAISNALLERHKKTVHSSVRPFGCQVCGKTFKISISLKAHMRSHSPSEREIDEDNNKDKKFVCDQPNCGFRSTKKTYLMDHKASVHSNERPFECDVDGCGKTFKIRRRLNIHMKTHSEDSDKQSDYPKIQKPVDKKYVCDEPGCSFKSPKSTYLMEHLNEDINNKTINCTKIKSIKVLNSFISKSYLNFEYSKTCVILL